MTDIDGELNLFRVAVRGQLSQSFEYTQMSDVDMSKIMLTGWAKIVNQFI